MSEKEAIEQMKSFLEFDEESRHVAADELIVEFLQNQGYEKLAKVYSDLTDDVWYA